MDSDDKRKSLRHRVFKGGKIVLGLSGGAIDCSILDLSDTGAKLRVRDVTTLPAEFRLLIVSESAIVATRLAWQHGNIIGVEFTGPRRPAPPLKF